MNSTSKPESTALVATEQGRMAVANMQTHAQAVREVMASVLKKGVDYGVIKGTDKPTLLKPGAEKLCMAFHIAPEYKTEDLSTADYIRYRSTCYGRHQQTGIVLGSGQGEASTSESKYKWREAVCPEEFETTLPNMRRVKWFRGYKDKPAYSKNQVRTEPDDAANTALKMGNKRALIAMVLNVLAASDVFNQDLEELSKELREHFIEGDGPGDEDDSYPEEQFSANLEKWHKAIKAGMTTVEQKIAQIETKYTLTEDQKQRLHPDSKAGDATQAAGAATTAVAEAMASIEQIAALRKVAVENTISDAEICKHLKLATLDKLTLDQLKAAQAFIDNPLG